MKNDFKSFSTSIADVLPPVNNKTSSETTTNDHTKLINSLLLSDDNTNYDQPENFLEIEIVSARTYNQDNSFVTIYKDTSTNIKGTVQNKQPVYTDYEIICRTNISLFKKHISKVRRRYSDFVFFKKCLLQELALNIANSNNNNSSKINIPDVPSKMILNNRFNYELIHIRLLELEKWLQMVVGHPLLRSNSKVLKRFIQEESFVG
ncbi:related to Sorting nexin-3 [Hanseniaspora guilliermondii]|uniref:Sorting nexin-3 n=1 Tax=Hanseniaspora guilliermondii TaxID=56406 RepID=A0A1L0AXG7_9ASCO|nr:related to Sorting nexin-3 [Hanseniaspora guilliermondii]